MIILTHRGLEPSKKDFYPESSYQAFKNHLERGFGIEFDVTFTKDKKIVISHDSNLNRITNSKDKRNFSEINLDEIKKIEYGSNLKGRIADFDELAELIKQNVSPLNALHLKGVYQTQDRVNILISKLKEHRDILDKILIFDVRPETAKIFRQEIP
ncbi:MAG: glycerophosphodiester phosphodiesterase family protein, partial [Candidatus Pacearchaeota archaeon]|nr:glycerophosphodiester phosphodiesterase family protein [Candidatus Pacearchaeota archaeon]